MFSVYKNAIILGFTLVVALISIGFYQAWHNQWAMDDAVRFAISLGSEDANRDYKRGKWRFLTVSRSEWFTYVVGVDSDTVSSCLIEQYGGDRLGQSWLLDLPEVTDRDYAATIEELRNSPSRTLIYANAYNGALLEQLKGDSKARCL